MPFNKLTIDYLLFVVFLRGGSFSFILLVKLLKCKSAAECFSPNLFILPAACVGMCECEAILTGLRLGASLSITVWKTRFFHQPAAEPPFI